jgi:hypothetical protein
MNLMNERRGTRESGIGLIEVMAATLVATLAVVGLAYSFGIGRGLIDRYAVARRAMGRAELVIDSLSTISPTLVHSGSEPFWAEGIQAGSTSWAVTPVDDPADGIRSPADPNADPNPVDMKRIVVTVAWNLGGSSDELAMTAMVLPK